MLFTDPIVDEVRKAREAHAAKFNYDLEKIFKDIKNKEKESGRKFVRYQAKPLVSHSKVASA